MDHPARPAASRAMLDIVQANRLLDQAARAAVAARIQTGLRQGERQFADTHVPLKGLHIHALPGQVQLHHAHEPVGDCGWAGCGHGCERQQPA